MRDYYNTKIYSKVPKYQLGKVIQLLEKTAASKGHTVYKYLGYLKNLAGKDNKELIEGIDKYRNLLVRGIKYDKNKKVTEGTNKELFDALQKIAQGHRKTSIYQSRKKAFWDNMNKVKEITAKTEKAQMKPTTETPKPENTIREAVANATSAVQGRYAKMKQAMKNHPWITGAALLGLTNGTTRNAIGTGLQYYLTPYSQWGSIGQPTQNTTQQLRLNDGSVVPVTMGEDGVLKIAQPSQETGVDPTDAAIAQTIAEANTPESIPETDSDSVGGYTTNEDFNDLFESDAWDQ